MQQLVLVATALEALPIAICGAAFFGPQHALASLQQAKPSAQHFCGASQQAWFSAQHFWPFSQQPSRAFAVQQALFSLQQASLAEQQSLGFSPATTAPVSKRPSANSFTIMEVLQSM